MGMRKSKRNWIFLRGFECGTRVVRIPSKFLVVRIPSKLFVFDIEKMWSLQMQKKFNRLEFRTMQFRRHFFFWKINMVFVCSIKTIVSWKFHMANGGTKKSTEHMWYENENIDAAEYMGYCWVISTIYTSGRHVTNIHINFDAGVKIDTFLRKIAKLHFESLQINFVCPLLIFDNSLRLILHCLIQIKFVKQEFVYSFEILPDSIKME